MSQASATTSSAGACPRCKRTAHGGACANPQPLAPAPLRDGAARMASHVGKRAPIDAPNAERASVEALHAARQLGKNTDGAWMERWRRDYLDARAAGATSTARAMCFELDASEVRK